MTSENRLGVAHSADRLAESILALVSSADDATTLSAWASKIGKSEATLRTHCRAARIKPKDALDFARLLRPSVVMQIGSQHLQDVLDVVDQRTLRSLGKRSSIANLEHRLVQLTPQEFIAEQQLTSEESLRHAVRDRIAVMVHRTKSGA